MLLLTPRQEAGRVLKKNDRNVVEVAEPDESRIFLGGIDIDLPRGDGRIVGNEANDIAPHAAKRGDGIASAICLRFQEITVVTQLLDQNTDIKWRVEPSWRVERLPQQYVDVDCLSRDRV